MSDRVLLKQIKAYERLHETFKTKLSNVLTSTKRSETDAQKVPLYHKLSSDYAGLALAARFAYLSNSCDKEK